MSQRYVTTWRKPAPDQFDWNHHVSDSIEEVEKVIANIKQRGVHQYHTWPIGELVTEHSSEY
jgi:hypothetical protein